MHDMISGRDLHVRSLNHLIRDHRFSYVGARIFAESIDSSVIDSWTDEYIARKTRANRRQAYWKHSLFKGFGRDGKPEYRKCVVGSPTTTLTEIWLLSRLSREEAFALPPYVYSYQWSSSRTHVFRYFFKGYMDREREIAQATKEMADSRVVVFDLRKFYPSIQVSTVRDRFAKRVARSNLNPEERATAFQCIDELTSIEQVKGLPIGSPLSHMLANVFLENFDRKLSDKFGGRYFRYVDDVAIVVPRGDLKSAKLFFIDTAAEDGLEVNSEKEDVVTGEKWADRVARRDQDEGDSLARLFSDLRRYLGHRQHDYDRIHDNFRAEGFAFPFPRLRSVAATSP